MVYRRGIFFFINRAFNKVDENRLATVGSDRLCAEWIIKNGGFIRFKDMGKLYKDYNTLPNEETKLTVKEIHASESSIMTVGFDHLRDCKNVEKIILHSCHEIDNEALDQLRFVQNTLKHLEIDNCSNIGDKGLLAVANLINLEKLVLRDLKNVKTMVPVEEVLKKALINCKFLINQ